MPLVPANFVVPRELRTDRFHLRPLTIHDVVKDYAAMMSRGAVTKGLTLEQNLMDLGWHQVEFQRRSSFTYTVMNPDESTCLGCVYIYPSDTEGIDADIHMWVRGEEANTGLDGILCAAVRRWIESDWCFAHVAYPGRDTVSPG